MFASAKYKILWITLVDGGRGIVYYNSYNMQIMYISKVLKIGNSLGLVVPIEILRAHKIERGDTVVFGFAGNGQIFFRKITDQEIQNIKGYEIS